MSSPLGGPYIAAYNRVHKSELEKGEQVQLNVHVDFQFDDNVFVEVEQPVITGKEVMIQNDMVTIAVLVTLLPSGLFQFDCNIELNENKSGYKFAGRQLVCVEYDERVTTLVEGEAQAKLTVSCVKS
ncbi:hypothetical protein [Aliikangiella sp. G2MR2-5]|uniref:hypothetical protein n=1 Tax=Aliikangiella sp. G2MR2-5 TaxID=2788943 RepID=UPI0018A9B1F1|nr:hypothetical protein [Aliikangiella sp. G2MR2-5]